MYKLSVIVCVYNEEDCIIRALKSLYNNKIYWETELIIIDDCSSNPFTIRLLSLLEKYTRVKIIRSLENKGLSNSRNLGFANAVTAYIMPLDADDILPPCTLDNVYQTFIDNQEIDFIAGDYFITNTDKNETALVSCSSIATNGLIDIKKLAIDWKLLGTSPCKKTVWESVGGYSTKYSYSIQDVDFWIRAIQAGNKGLYLNKPIYTWNKSSTGMNMNFDRIDMIKLLEDHREFYLLNCTKRYLYNKIFEGYYPYKQKQILIPFAKKHFIYLTNLNRLRSINIFLRGLFGKKISFKSIDNLLFW